jgi:hypothetical protein
MTTTQTTRNATSTGRRISTETKAAVKPPELIAYVAALVPVLVAAQIAANFQAQDAWFYVTLLTIGYLVSRGLAKSGSRDCYDDDTRQDAGRSV